MQEPRRSIVFRNLANIVSILGVLPICILFRENGYQYLLPLIIYNNFMDDLDGVLAGKLNIRSDFGALLDNVCDAIAHAAFVMVVGMRFVQKTTNPYLGGLCLAACLIATAAIVIRVVNRITPSAVSGTGSPTNELVRHTFFVLLVTQLFGVDPAPYLIVTFVLHSVSMLVPFKMPFMIRSMAKSATAIGMVNIALLIAWLLPYAVPVVAALFIVTYFVSFAAGGFRWLRETNTSH